MIFRRALQAATILGVVAAVFLFVQGYDQPASEILDHHNYRVAIEGMRTGESYYAAYEQGFRDVYGPIPASRDVRFPTTYVLLTLASPGSEHIAFAAMALVAGLIPAIFAAFPPSGVLVTVYLLTLAVADNGAAQFLYAEFWIIPAVLGAVFAIDRGYERLALVLGVVAFAIREQGILLLAGTVAHLWIRGRHRIASIVCVGLAVAGWFAHLLALNPYVDAENGLHTPLHLGENPFASMMATLDFGLSIPGLGLAFLVGAFLWAKRHRLLLAVGPYLAIPVLTLWVNRQYWGILVIPLAIVLTFDQVSEWFTERDINRSMAPKAVAGP